jgi:SAM-dependent methyltransferase
MTDSQVLENLKQYRFYHSIPLQSGISTPGHQEEWINNLWSMVLDAIRSVNVKDQRVLDIGCRDGLYSFEAEKLGAREIVAIDNDLSEGAVNFLIPYFGSRVQMHEMNLYDLTPEQFGRFDVICFPGVLYHLRYPFWGLKIIRDLLNDGGTLILETNLFVDDNRRATLYCPFGLDAPGLDPTNCAQFNLKGLVDTLFSLGITVDRVEYLGDGGLVRESRPEVEVTPADFDEAYYVEANPDVAEAIRSNSWKLSGYHHWVLKGREEGRNARLHNGTLILPTTKVTLEDQHYKRAVFIARKTPDVINSVIQDYLEGRHEIHSGEIHDSHYGAWEMFPKPRPVTQVTQYRPRQRSSPVLTP